jgi:hydrogenase maturation protease
MSGEVPHDRARPRRTLVLGVGNLLLGDEGFGIHAVRALSSENLPGWVTVEDGGTGGVDLLDRIASFERVILIDLVRPVGGTGETERDRGSEALGGPIPEGAGPRDLVPGGVVVFRLNRVELTNPDPDLSLHGCSLGGIVRLADALGVTLPQIDVVGFIPHSIGWSTELSPPAHEGLAIALERVRGLLLEEGAAGEG